MVVITPTVSAILATVLTVSGPAATVHDGVVDGPPLSVSLLYAVGGAIGGIVAVVLAIGMYCWARYLIHGDPHWRAGYVVPGGLRREFGITCAAPITLASVGTMEMWVKEPTGRLAVYPDRTLQRHGNPATFYLPEEPTVPGGYELRWVREPPDGPKREICRTKVSVAFAAAE